MFPVKILPKSLPTRYMWNIWARRKCLSMSCCICLCPFRLCCVWIQQYIYLQTVIKKKKADVSLCAACETKRLSPSAGGSVPDLLLWRCSVSWLKMAAYHQPIHKSTLVLIKSSSHNIMVWFNQIIVIMISVMLYFRLLWCLIFVFIAVIFQLLLCTFQITGILCVSCETDNNKAPLFISLYIVLSLLLVLSRFCMDGTLWRQSNTFSHC